MINISATESYYRLKLPMLQSKFFVWPDWKKTFLSELSDFIWLLRECLLCRLISSLKTILLVYILHPSTLVTRKIKIYQVSNQKIKMPIQWLRLSSSKTSIFLGSLKTKQFVTQIFSKMFKQSNDEDRTTPLQACINIVDIWVWTYELVLFANLTTYKSKSQQGIG